ncbi:flagellar biosynthesis protein FlhF [Novosphingobium endophyticum]|uniref:Flagellar biosynthesis protein FlhF n=1 Tax=Novosphingobium endophyticum TaxID=1955250 RepID=A0A916TR57_9SPHN|nr:DUF2062 domain-containing protein [Novosphingobium endophyticum]GGB95513.1 flagellar biosynthesis protein FlhF [Novosphingobium endophyticum]
MPKREDFERNRWIAPIAHRVLSPELWRFTRRSVPRGVALGLFAGFIVPVGQIFLAAFLAMPARANVSIAALVTFVTNPFTLPFWVVVANRVGRFMLHVDPTGVASAVGAGWGASGWETFVWFARSAALTTIGFVVLSIVTSALGYVVSGVLWRSWIGRKRRARRERHAARTRAIRESQGCETAA